MKFYSAVSLCLGLAFSSLPAFAAAGGSDRGGGDLRKLDASTIEMLLKGEHLKSAMVNYLDSIKLDQVDDGQVKDTLSRISLEALRDDILTRDNYKSGWQCQDSYNHNVPASAKIGDRGGEICFNTYLISEQLKGRTVEDGFIRLAALAFHEHVHHFQSQSTHMRKNEDEAYRVADYVLLTAKTIHMPSLNWTIQPDPQSPQNTDEMSVTGLAQGTMIQIPVDAYIPAQTLAYTLNTITIFHDGQEIEFSCGLAFPSSKKDRKLKATFELIVDTVSEMHMHQKGYYHSQPNQDSCWGLNDFIGDVKLNGVPRTDIRFECTASYPIAQKECPFDSPATTISDLRKWVESSGGTFTPTCSVPF